MQIIKVVICMKKRQVVCITGAGSGLGKEAVINIAKRGHKVIACVLYKEQIEGLKKIKEKYKLDIEILKLDITNEEDRNKLSNYNIDVFISNAAIADSGSIAEIDIKRIKDVFKVNVFSNIQLTQIVLKNMIEKNKKRKNCIFIFSYWKGSFTFFRSIFF